MKTDTDIKQNHIDTIAQFLLVNSEAIDDNGLDGRIPLIYFFFMYSEKYSKPDYSDFAFEILEDLLIEEISKIENHKGVGNSKISGIGWSLIQFFKDGYFESDDLEDILELMDNAAFLDIDKLLSNKLQINFNGLIVHINYILERKKLIKSNTEKHNILNYKLEALLFCLNKNCGLIEADDYLIQLCCLDIINGLEEKNCNPLKNKIEKSIIKNKIRTTLDSFITVRNYEKALVFNKLHCSDTDVYKKNLTDLLRAIKQGIKTPIEALLQAKKESYKNLLSKFVIQALFLCKDGELPASFFLTGLFNNLK